MLRLLDNGVDVHPCDDAMHNAITDDQSLAIYCQLRPMQFWLWAASVPVTFIDIIADRVWGIGYQTVLLGVRRWKPYLSVALSQAAVRWRELPRQ